MDFNGHRRPQITWHRNACSSASIGGPDKLYQRRNKPFGDNYHAYPEPQRNAYLGPGAAQSAVATSPLDVSQKDNSSY